MSAHPVPEGFWQRESTENPQPVSAMLGSFFLEALTEATRHLCAELGVLLETAEWRAIDGWVYLRTVPFQGDEQAVADRLNRGAEAFVADLPARYLGRWEEEWRPWLQRRAGELGGVELQPLDDAGLDAHVQDVILFLFAAVDVHQLLHGSNALMLGELVFACRDLLGWDEAQVFDLVSGSSTDSTEPARRLGELAQLIRLGATDTEFAAAFDRYVEEFGGRAIRYEVIDPTIGERPDLLLRLVRDQLEREFDAAAVAARLGARRTAAEAAARASLAETAPDDRARFERLLERARRFYPVREDNEVWTISLPLGLARRALLEIGARLVASGATAEVDDVFHLTLGEARTALRERADPAVSHVRELVMARRADRIRAAAQPAPPTFGTPPPEADFSLLPPVARLIHEAIGWLIDRIVAPGAGLRRQAGPAIDGIAASAGRCTGPVRVVRTERDFDKLQPGDVLVCPATAPAWSVIFPSVAALVADTGGIISHHAILAREFGIPAVVGTGNATDLLVDGQTVTVDGDRGRVERA